MPPFDNQFALTLELTRLLPIRWAVDKAKDAVMRQARDLRHSGSDIVVEEDLTEVFGRCRISSALESSFKTVVAQSASHISLVGAIMLQAGPGPTVVRAFQASPYFAMIVQLSLLTWTFNANYLATALAESLRKRSEGASPSLELPSSPDRMSILGVLQAIESQTTTFNWNLKLHAVSTTLGYNVLEAPLDFPDFVLQGLLDMLPMVQTLPRDRFILIQIPAGENTSTGVSALVVWAHHVLDLTVLVRMTRTDKQRSKDIRFGDCEVEQVVIEEVPAADESAIVLLDTQKEHLLKIKPELDSEYGLIGSVRRIPARGYGNVNLVESPGWMRITRMSSNAVIKDLQIVSCAFAFIVAKHLVRDDSERNIDEHSGDMRSPMLYYTDQLSLLNAARFLFDNPNLKQGEVESYVAQYSRQPLNEDLPMPSAMQVPTPPDVLVKDHEAILREEWNRICYCLKQMSVLLLAMAHIVNLEDCKDLIVHDQAFEKLSQHPLAQQLEEWDGECTLLIKDDAWLQAVAVPLLGPSTNMWNLPWSRICLISDRGWSAWISTFASCDPSYTKVGSVYLGCGRPCRNGIWKNGIWDAWNNTMNFHTGPEKAESRSQIFSLRCGEKVTFADPYCGEGDDVFLVLACFKQHKVPRGQSALQRAGYKDLQRALWWARLTESCSHTGSRYNEMKLPVGCATITGFGNHLYNPDERILIYLTAHSVGARWMALLCLPWLGATGDHEVEELDTRQILLRKDDCCLQCAVHEATSKAGTWFIVL